MFQPLYALLPLNHLHSLAKSAVGERGKQLTMNNIVDTTCYVNRVAY